MRKILFLIIVVVILGGWWYTSHRSNGTPYTIDDSKPVSGRPSLANATFKFDDVSVTLKNGKASLPQAPDSVSVTDIELSDVVGYGDVNADGKEDVAAIVIQSGAGSGIFLNLVAYVSGPVSYKGTAAAFVGDRVDPTAISIKNKIITVTYLERKSGEPLAAEPTITTNKAFTYNEALNTLEER